MRGGESVARIIMCGSFKGGVGKTDSSWNLAYSLAEMGKRVLAVDFDSQANLTTCFGIEDPAAVPVTIGHLMMNRLSGIYVYADLYHSWICAFISGI